ncbi:MAG: 2-oxoacid:acceptor oxidoreductase family protein [Bacteroidales bacterium]|jgi:2-oxoglutarate ferredoxin oxidoreductase subunit gamma|nr:2-oxoacid:acceptor oxidoreductase family protein [Bacteroidales bacterium]MDD2593033.1 2-oxoacid:acceptor oxidoreductase family protein [Bacteroidales bacterium]HHW59981.1 2-oxoglutarate ferredoxin oxidoreductase subunit gamma [Bacteroidales bacterium]
MTEEIIIAGFGGQGVQSMGKILATSGMKQGLNVSWFPSYGPEMRGGTSNVTVILSDERISSPVLNEYDTAIVLNQPSIDKFENSIKPGGILIYDPHGITRHPQRNDIEIYQVEAANKASEAGNMRIFNMIVLGGYLKIKSIVSLDFIEEGLKESLPERHHHLIPANLNAIKIGQEIIKKIN